MHVENNVSFFDMLIRIVVCCINNFLGQSFCITKNGGFSCVPKNVSFELQPLSAPYTHYNGTLTLVEWKMLLPKDNEFNKVRAHLKMLRLHPPVILYSEWVV